MGNSVRLRFFMCTGIVFSVFSLLSFSLSLVLHRNFILSHFVCTCFRFLYFTILMGTHIAFQLSIHAIEFLWNGLSWLDFVLCRLCVCDMVIRTNLWLISLTIQRVHCCAISITCPNHYECLLACLLVWRKHSIQQ